METQPFVKSGGIVYHLHTKHLQVSGRKHSTVRMPLPYLILDTIIAVTTLKMSQLIIVLQGPTFVLLQELYNFHTAFAIMVKLVFMPSYLK